MACLVDALAYRLISAGDAWKDFDAPRNLASDVLFSFTSALVEALRADRAVGRASIGGGCRNPAD